MQRRQKHEKCLLVTVQPITNQGITNLTTADYLFAADVYVAYRSQHPDEETREKVTNKMKENNIDFSLLVEYSTHHCQQVESSTERGSPAYRHWRRKRNGTFYNFRYFGQLNIYLVCTLLYQNQKLYIINLNITQMFPFPHFESWRKDQKIYGNFV